MWLPLTDEVVLLAREVLGPPLLGAELVEHHQAVPELQGGLASQQLPSLRVTAVHLTKAAGRNAGKSTAALEYSRGIVSDKHSVYNLAFVLFYSFVTCRETSNAANTTTTASITISDLHFICTCLPCTVRS